MHIELCFEPSSFWAFTLSLYFCFTTVFSPLTSSIENSSQARVVAKQVRCGSGDQRPNFAQKIKKIDLALHRRLKQNFPDWEDRMDYQKTQ